MAQKECAWYLPRMGCCSAVQVPWLAICLFALKTIFLPSIALLPITRTTMFKASLTTSFLQSGPAEGWRGWREGEVKVFLPLPWTVVCSSAASSGFPPTGHPYPASARQSPWCYLLQPECTVFWKYHFLEVVASCCCLYLGSFIFPWLTFQVLQHLYNQFQYYICSIWSTWVICVSYLDPEGYTPHGDMNLFLPNDFIKMGTLMHLSRCVSIQFWIKTKMHE